MSKYFPPYNISSGNIKVELDQRKKIMQREKI